MAVVDRVQSRCAPAAWCAEGLLQALLALRVELIHQLQFRLAGAGNAGLDDGFNLVSGPCRRNSGGRSSPGRTIVPQMSANGEGGFAPSALARQSVAKLSHVQSFFTESPTTGV